MTGAGVCGADVIAVCVPLVSSIVSAVAKINVSRSVSGLCILYLRTYRCV